MSVTTGHRQWYRCAMAYSQVVSVTTSAQTITLDGSARWLEFRPLGAAGAITVTVSTAKPGGVITPAVSEANDMETFALDTARIVRLAAGGAPSFSIIASSTCKVFVRGVDV